MDIDTIHLDIYKAFENVPRQSLIKILNNMEFPTCLWLQKTLYYTDNYVTDHNKDKTQEYVYKLQQNFN